ncbi:MAG: hypothetical protein ACP5D2_02730 [Candidatus Nanoarchaeia archaeon]
MKIKTDDILGFGLILVSIFLFFFSIDLIFREELNLIIGLSGVIGSIIVLIAEIVFIKQKWFQKI